MDALENFGKAFSQLKIKIIEFMPNFATAALILLLGVILAKVAKSLTNRFLTNLGRLVPDKNIRSRLNPARLSGSAELIGKIVYWFIIFFFITAATEVLGLPVLTSWLGEVVNYLPNLLVAILIIAAGAMGGMILRDIIESAANTAGITYGNILGKAAQYAVLLTSALIAAEQIGIDITLLTGVILIILGALLFGASLAFGLGARESVSNILASHFLQKLYKVGQIVKIDEVCGEIIEITPLAVILKTDKGNACIPAKQFLELASILYGKDS